MPSSNTQPKKIGNFNVLAKLGEGAVDESLRSFASELGNADGTVTIPYVTELFLAVKRAG